MSDNAHPLPPWTEPAPLPADPRSATLVALNGWWLDVRCGTCGQITGLPLRLMCARHGWEMRLADLLARLRCTSCGGEPATADLTDDPAAGASGRPGREATRVRVAGAK